ncbi:energy-coupling factor ABC transporter permease [Accumulibacter sp.]|uniref:energy-coupling factor ABC transporter permease n=1 Tax=Accumulibacter sp. TaxID=2053492 RepID=UPI0025EC5DE8|nr:energy-coupling factor ABC transporter permease [Accumulibacter sp.]MCM8593873.1 energy-coupling factor ABC transporter permease [Accumulibacter sp.]MCM8626085.1 energy-coupling factor ABC transporter permease [Accumulibacter sp.]MDS4048014.1 energy-coupling factor ABC transporter permease [Accumulibacter sp.]
MHMADALLSPAVGGTFWAVTAGTAAYCARKLRGLPAGNGSPLMGVLGAFLFAAQMINFSIPGTGSSGHLGGGLLLTILLGPYAAFLTVSSVLIVQALFFADGGLLALGCNIFNMAFLPAFVAYPLIYRPIAGDRPGAKRLSVACVVAAVVALQLGAFAVVVETLASGISALPFATFVLFMLPIHLAIGLVEGFVTAAIVGLVGRARPDLLDQGTAISASAGRSATRLIGVLFCAALVTGGLLSWFASEDPDGLEWSIARVAGEQALDAPAGGLHGLLAGIQQRLAVFPDYGFAKEEDGRASGEAGRSAEDPSRARIGSSVSGIVGALVTLVLVVLIGVLLRWWTRPARAPGEQR